MEIRSLVGVGEFDRVRDDTLEREPAMIHRLLNDMKISRHSTGGATSRRLRGRQPGLLHVSLPLFSLLLLASGCPQPKGDGARKMDTAGAGGVATNLAGPDSTDTLLSLDDGLDADEALDGTDLLNQRLNPSKENNGSNGANTTGNIPPAWVTAPGEWTMRRLIALTRSGPTMLDLRVRVGELDLDTAAAAAIDQLADELSVGFESPVRWDEFLEQPLVQSGWLGNLIPEEEQVEQLLGMYDADADAMVTRDELGPFLSRGLSRNASLLVSDAGNEAGMSNASPWGPGDSDEDYSLTDDELNTLGTQILVTDRNGDRIVTRAEATRTNEPTATVAMQSTSLLETNTLLIPESSVDETARDARGTVKLASRVLSHYTFLEGIPREQWSNWSDTRWAALDVDADGLLDRRDLETLLDLPADVEVFVQLPIAKSPTEQKPTEQKPSSMMQSTKSDTASVPQVWARVVEPQPGSDKLEGAPAQVLATSPTPAAATFHWNATAGGEAGQIRFGELVLRLETQDDLAEPTRRALRSQLDVGLKNAQLRVFLTAQLQLAENAFELVDLDADEQLSDEEFERVWGWLTARQATRLQARWMVASAPWFQLLDSDGDNRLTALELKQCGPSLASLDASGDQRLTPNELPLVAILELKRADSRLDLGPLAAGAGASDVPVVDQDWFSAMDTNRDGVIGKSEFLGSYDDFSGLDADNDGFIGRQEVY